MRLLFFSTMVSAGCYEPPAKFDSDSGTVHLCDVTPSMTYGSTSSDTTSDSADSGAYTAPDSADSGGPPLSEACAAVSRDYDDLLLTIFQACADGTRVGQIGAGDGFTCLQACCAFGFAGCTARGAQSGFSACGGSSGVSGTCDDVFQPAWSSECRCE